MKTITIDGFIEYRPKSYGIEQEFYFHNNRMAEYGYVEVMPYSFAVEIPDDFDPRAQQVEMLKEKKRELMVAFQARCTEIERQISELTAITCEATE